MESLEEYVIGRYMTIDQRISRLEQKKRYKRWAFYQQSFYTSIAYTGYEIVSQSIKADKAIENLDERMRPIDHQVGILKMKQGFWKKFFSSLSAGNQRYFKNKYIQGYDCLNERLDQLATEEIEEINQAIVMCYCTKTEYKEQIELVENDFMGNIDRLLNVVGV
jgi:hypothetical protein